MVGYVYVDSIEVKFHLFWERFVLFPFYMIYDYFDTEKLNLTVTKPKLN